MAASKTTIKTPDNQEVDYPARLLTIAQLEEAHPGFKGRTRGYILRADLNSPDFAGLRDAVVRMGRSVYVDELRFLGWTMSRRAAAPDKARNPHGRAGKQSAPAPKAKGPTAKKQPAASRRDGGGKGTA